MSTSGLNKPTDDVLEEAARQALERAEDSKRNPEPSMGKRLAHIGILGWLIVLPVLLAAWIGRQLDQYLGTDVLFSAASVMLGAGLGLWFAWQWMHRQ